MDMYNVVQLKYMYMYVTCMYDISMAFLGDNDE